MPYEPQAKISRKFLIQRKLQNSQSRETDLVISLVGPGTENACAG
jgi:hypothetical protein